MVAPHETSKLLEQHGIRPSAQRVAIADYVLRTTEHPGAEAVWAAVKRSFPMVSRATVYNSLNLFVKQGLLRELSLAVGHVAYDANLAPHHHFVDDADGSIHDLPWSDLQVRGIARLQGLDVREHSVVVRGRRTRARKRS